MATTVDTLLVRIEADMSDLKQSLAKVQRDVDKSSQGIAGAFRKIGTAMKAAVAAVLVREAVRGGMAMINLASDIEEMQGKSSVVFGAFRDEVVSALDEFGNAVGRSTHELEGMAASIQDTFVPMGFARGEAAKLSVDLTKLAVDVGSFNNVLATDVMDAFQSALVGNHETVRRFGVIITQATLDQELMNMGIAKGVKEATNAEKVQARLNIITRGVSDAQGDAARTSGSFANQLLALKAEVSELAGDVGRELIPVAKELVKQFLEATIATRKLLEAMGFIEKTQPTLQQSLNTTSANVDYLSGALEDLTENGKYAKTVDFNSLFTEFKVDPNAPDSIDQLIAKISNATGEARKKLLQLQIDVAKGLSNAYEATDTPSSQTEEGEGDASTELTEKLKQQRKELAATSSEMLISATNQRLLDDAIRSGNKALERSTRENIILNDLKKKFPELAKDNISLLQREAASRANVEMNTRAQSVALEALKKIQEDYAASVQRGVDHVTDALVPNNEFLGIQKDLDNALKAGKISAEQYEAVMAQLKLQMLETSPIGSVFLNGFENMANGVSDALADMATGGKVTLDQFKEMFKGFVRQMLAQALKLIIVNSILRAMGVPLRYTGSGFEAGKGDMFGNELAGGGTAQPRRPVLVGERGPEIFVPHSAGTVMNNHNSKNAMGSGQTTVVNQTINVETGVSQTVRAEMISLLPRFKQEAQSSVLDQKRRGGSYARALG